MEQLMTYKELKSRLGDELALAGKNEDGQNIILEYMSKDAIRLTTIQNNGWLRHNVYHSDGCIEEYYEK